MRFLLASIVLCLAGCVTAAQLADLRPGMARGEVIQIMGEPSYTGFVDGSEYLYYRIPASGGEGWASRGLVRQDYVVRLADGKVSAYGRAQDVVPIQVAPSGTTAGPQSQNTTGK